jgi:hypothetical protein
MMYAHAIRGEKREHNYLFTCEDCESEERCERSKSNLCGAMPTVIKINVRSAYNTRNGTDIHKRQGRKWRDASLREAIATCAAS